MLNIKIATKSLIEVVSIRTNFSTLFIRDRRGSGDRGGGGGRLSIEEGGGQWSGLVHDHLALVVNPPPPPLPLRWIQRKIRCGGSTTTNREYFFLY